MAVFNERKAAGQLTAEAKKIRPENLEALLAKQRAIEDKVKGSGKLNRFKSDIKLMFDMIRDYWNGSYRDVPWKSIAAIAGALVYVLNPLDLIPDLLIGIGFLDDAGVVALCLKLVETDLFRYAAWKEQQREVTDSHPTN